ncbi:UbiA family prenyltransferase [uncultured Roseobacter sp.]|uniref:UbiA family prenyltransferase n=1 Tax=uncultured Roseobacter sp. TaxID=114847 RepID=UPI00260E696D|nr:UbiA family prenyltransferase [uncultured Roseobacter sp.]
MKKDTDLSADRFPLCVDLDGTLTTTDTLHEAVLRAVKRAPLTVLKLLPTALRSKAAFKRRIAQIAPTRAETLPLNTELVTYIEEQRRTGRRVDLVSAADQSVVDAVAAHLPLFDTALGSDGSTNLSAHRKLTAIQALHGTDFVYAGDSRADIPIWRETRHAIVVGSRSFAHRATGQSRLEALFLRHIGWRDAFRAMRPHQWAKNLLLLVPMILGGPDVVRAEILTVLLGFLALSCIASAGYLFNDLMDIEADRAHPSKHRRPFASGALKPVEGIWLFVGLLTLGGGVAVTLGWAFTVTCVLYFCGTMLYSFWLKRRPLVDIMMLASLYTLRIVAGATLTAEAFSFWIFTFSMFIFASLAILKRYTELVDEGIHETVRKSRGYTAVDLPLLLPFGAGSSVAAALLFVIYLVEERFPSGAYARPELLWLIFPILLFWQMHMWRAAVHGKVHEDPVLFAIKDWISRTLGAISMLIIVLSW